MKIWNQINEICLHQPTAIALGAFDGLHKGHNKVIQAALCSGAGEPSVFTFERNPHGNAQLILSNDKETLLNQMGIQNLFCIPFETVKNVSAEDFLQKILWEKCNVRMISCGEDFRFGKQAKGNVKMLEDFCRSHKIELSVLPDMKANGERISSTQIRKAIEDGDIHKANQLLGRPFSFTLPVVKGNQLGRTLGTPTINQPLPKGFILPKFAIYASMAEVDGKRYQAVTNIGIKPTVGSDVVLAETWILDFSGDLYGQSIKIELIEFIRPEVKFDSIEALKLAILQDGEIAKKILAKM